MPRLLATDAPARRARRTVDEGLTRRLPPARLACSRSDLLIRARASWRVPASGGHGTSVIEEFVDGPLVVGVSSVFERGDPPVRSDQKICWQPEATSGGLDRSERAALRAVISERGGLTGDRRAQSARAQQRARSALHAEPPIQHPFRVGDQRERQLG